MRSFGNRVNVATLSGFIDITRPILQIGSHLVKSFSLSLQYSIKSRYARFNNSSMIINCSSVVPTRVLVLRIVQSFFVQAVLDSINFAFEVRIISVFFWTNIVIIHANLRSTSRDGLFVFTRFFAITVHFSVDKHLVVRVHVMSTVHLRLVLILGLSLIPWSVASFVLHTHVEHVWLHCSHIGVFFLLCGRGTDMLIMVNYVNRILTSLELSLRFMVLTLAAY
jgi:hypothetical protein